MALFTAETARLAAQESAVARAKQSAERKTWEKLLRDAQTPKTAQADAEPPKDPYVDNLARAQTEFLAKLRACENAKDAAALSQTLKNLRETYHMASGQPKPGTIKPESRRTRQQPARPPEPEPIDPTTTQ